MEFLCANCNHPDYDHVHIGRCCIRNMSGGIFTCDCIEYVPTEEEKAIIEENRRIRSWPGDVLDMLKSIKSMSLAEFYQAGLVIDELISFGEKHFRNR